MTLPQRKFLQAHDFALYPSVFTVKNTLLNVL